MSIATFDTLKFSRRLKAAGVSQEQAKAEAEALKDAFSEALDTQVASKADVYEIRATLKLHGWMLAVVLGFVVAIFWKLY